MKAPTFQLFYATIIPVIPLTTLLPQIFISFVFLEHNWCLILLVDCCQELALLRASSIVAEVFSVTPCKRSLRRFLLGIIEKAIQICFLAIYRPLRSGKLEKAAVLRRYRLLITPFKYRDPSNALYLI